MTSSERVLMEKKQDVAYITLNAPPVNIMTAEVMGALTEALKNAADDKSIKAVAIKANGKAFSAGADVGEHHPEKASVMIGAFSTLFRIFGELEIPVLMAVDGAALGAGFELVMMADILIASERATFGQPEIRLGFFAPVGVAYLPQLVGSAKAMEITATGRSYTAQEMKEYGLVNQVVAPEELEQTLENVLKQIRKASPLILRMNGRLIKKLKGRPFEDARLEAEKVFLEELMATEDVLEGINSFYEKRAPNWKNK